MRVGIIGGGAAGMMCAATINEHNPDTEVFLFEKNLELGKKVIISGGGRCNLTTGINDVKAVLKKYPRGEKFLHSAMYYFSPADTYDWFEKHRVPLKCEEDQRVFPVSNNGHDVVGAFVRIFKQSRTTILFKHSVKKIEIESNGFAITCENKKPILVEKVVLCLGGQTYRHTGSTGDGYSLAESFGHTITSLAPSLNSFISKEKWPKDLSGLSIKNALIYCPRDKKYKVNGSFLFTHIGITGPAVFALSSLAAFEQYNQKNPLDIFIDVYPDVSSDQLLQQVQIAMKESPKKTFKNTLHLILPKSLIETLFVQLQIPESQTNAQVSKQVLHNIISYIKKIPLSIIGRGAGDEFVTAGGVALEEINPSTMESKLCKGLYFAGEILNIDGFTGGFNLQASWATGYVAGMHI